MKKFSLLAICILLVCAMTACTSTTQKEPVIEHVEQMPVTPDDSDPGADAPSSNTPVDGTDTQEPEATEEPGKVADTTVIKDRYVDENGMMQSYLTGEWKDAAIVERRPMAVMTPNNKAAMPQYGISKASIIYEAPVEGRITRLMMFLEDYDDLDFIGPVRSSRDYYVYEAMAYDAIYVNWGLAVPFVEALLASDRIDNISQAVSGIHNPYPNAFFRRDRPGYKTEYTGYMYIDEYEKGVEHFKYSKNYRNTFEQAFTFANDGWPSTYDGYEEATKIYPGGSNDSNKSGYGSHRPSFEYNEEDGLYYRYQYDEPQIDELNGEQLAVANVVFKVCHGEVREPVSYDYLAFGVHGTGDAYIFTNGKVIKGTWKRNSDNSANMFYDDKGNEVIFNQGKTWICCIWDQYQDCMEWK